MNCEQKRFEKIVKVHEKGSCFLGYLTAIFDFGAGMLVGITGCKLRITVEGKARLDPPDTLRVTVEDVELRDEHGEVTGEVAQISTPVLDAKGQLQYDPDVWPHSSATRIAITNAAFALTDVMVAAEEGLAAQEAAKSAQTAPAEGARLTA